MLQYSIMAFILGFTGNKIFNKKNKSISTSIKFGSISCIILTIVDVLILIQ